MTTQLVTPPVQSDNHTFGPTKPPVRPPLAPLGQLTLAAMLGVAGLGIALQVVFFMGLDPPIGVIITLGALVSAGVTAARLRWGPGLGAVWGCFILAANAPSILRDLTSPENAPSFVFNVIALPVIATAIAAGATATWQNYRLAPAERRAPKWVRPVLIGVLGLVVGAMGSALLPRQSLTGVPASVLATLPTVRTASYAFNPPEIRAHAGETILLRLENSDAEAHSFDVDVLDVHAAMLPNVTGLAVVRATTPGTYSFRCGIPGHDHMQGTLVVGP